MQTNQPSTGEGTRTSAHNMGAHPGSQVHLEILG